MPGGRVRRRAAAVAGGGDVAARLLHGFGFFTRETARIFRRVWNFVGHDGQMPAPGDYATLDLAGVPLLLVRGRDGTVRGFANTCRHRGCRVVGAGAGNVRAFTCPYHGWVYGLDGRLLGAPQMAHTVGFDKSEHGLRPVRIERWGRFLFANLDSGAPPLADQLGELVDMLAPYDLDDMVLVRRRVIEIGCNWKGYVENLAEPYHTPTVHAGGMAAKNEDAGARMLSGNAAALFGGGGDGADVRLVFGANHAAIVSRHAGSRGLLPGQAPLPPIRGLAGMAAEGSIWAYVYPATVFSCQREGLWYNQVLPRGPDRMTLVIGSCFPAETVARPDFAARVRAYYERLDSTAAEDVVVCEAQQAGLASPLATAGRVCHLEAVAHAHRNWVADRVTGG